MATLNLFSKVDFAYPENVIKESTSQIEKAIKTNDTQNLVDGIIKLGIAKTLISQDYLPEVVNTTDSIANASTDMIAKALLYSIEADMLSDFLDNNKYFIYEREQTANRPDDIY